MVRKRSAPVASAMRLQNFATAIVPPPELPPLLPPAPSLPPAPLLDLPPVPDPELPPLDEPELPPVAREGAVPPRPFPADSWAQPPKSNAPKSPAMVAAMAARPVTKGAVTKPWVPRLLAMRAPLVRRFRWCGGVGHSTHFRAPNEGRVH